MTSELRRAFDPVAARRGLATAAFDTNGEKGTETWEVRPPGERGRWDGLVGWFLDQPATVLPRALVAWHRTLARVHAGHRR